MCLRLYTANNKLTTRETRYNNTIVRDDEKTKERYCLEEE